MKISLTSLASSSSGNCSVIKYKDTLVLSDCGISLKRIKAGLSALGNIKPEALLITHAHSDHIKSAAAAIKYFDIPLYITEGAFGETCLEYSPKIHIIEPEKAFDIGKIHITPFTVSHDAASSVAFSFETASDKASVITDTGFIDDRMLSHISGSSGIIIEANHDEEMLKNGPYPYFLKKRISGRYGHLSNSDCAKACLSLISSGTEKFMLAHLSEKNNTPEKAYSAVQASLASSGKKYILKTAHKSVPCVL